MFAPFHRWTREVLRDLHKISVNGSCSSAEDAPSHKWAEGSIQEGGAPSGLEGIRTEPRCPSLSRNLRSLMKHLGKSQGYDDL